jgi:hypothetical protein
MAKDCTLAENTQERQTAMETMAIVASQIAAYSTCDVERSLHLPVQT